MDQPEKTPDVSLVGLRLEFMSGTFYLHEAKVQPAINTITVNGVDHKIEPKIMQVLIQLVKAESEVVTKQYLLETVWAETIVVEMVLTRAISELRRVLGDKPTQPRFIETISKSGYRLIAPISQNRYAKKTRPLRQMPPIAIALTAMVLSIWLLSKREVTPEALVTQPLTFEKGWEYHPVLSPDANWVAYIGQTNNDHSDIFVRSTESDSSFKLTDSNGFYFKPCWAPDGSAIAAIGMGGMSRLQIFSVASRKLIDEVTVHSQYAGLSWSPNGEWLSYVAYDSSQARHSVFKYSLKDKQTSLQITTAPESWGDSEPKYSPDGQSLAFVRTVAEGDQDLYRLDLSTSTVHRLTKINRNILGFDWKDDNTVLMSSDVDGRDNLWSLRVSQSPATLEKIVKMPYGESIQNPTVRDGLLVGEKWMQDTDLVIAYIDDTVKSNTSQIASSQWELHPDISPDGKEIVFSSNRSGSYEIWKYGFNSGSLQQLTHFEAGFSGKPKWSPQGKHIVFESNAHGSHQIFVMAGNGSNLRQLTTDDGDYINPTWSRDGSFVYCASNIGGDWNIWAQALQNGYLRKVPSAGGYYLQEAPSHNRAFMTRLHQDGIWEIKMDGSEEVIIPELKAVDWGNWLIVKEGIYYLDRQQKKMSFYSFATGNKSELATITGTIPINEPAFTVSLETGQLVYGQLNSYSGDLVAIRNY